MSLAEAVLSFAAVAGLLTIIPGLDTALVLHAAISRGRRHAFATALGINTGALVWGAGAARGVYRWLYLPTDCRGRIHDLARFKDAVVGDHSSR